MPINATVEYFKAEAKFHKAKSNEEKIAALEEMIREIPKHKGAEHTLAQLRAKLAKLKKEGKAASAKRGGRKIGIPKEGEAQVCILGLTNSGKSSLLNALTNVKAEVGHHSYTTTKPEIGMMDYKGVKIQLVEIPSTFLPEYMGTCRTADAVLILYKNELEKVKVDEIVKGNFIHSKCIYADSFAESPENIKEKIWAALGLMVVYTKDKKHVSPMALRKGANVRDFALRVHKDFVKDFRFAILLRGKMKKQIGLNYILEDGDVVEVYIK